MDAALVRRVWRRANRCCAAAAALLFWKPDQALAQVTVKLPNNARDLDLHPDGTRLAVAYFDNAVRVYDLTPKPAK